MVNIVWLPTVSHHHRHLPFALTLRTLRPPPSPKASGVVLDLIDSASIVAAAQTVRERFGSIDVLVGPAKFEKGTDCKSWANAGTPTFIICTSWHYFHFCPVSVSGQLLAMATSNFFTIFLGQALPLRLFAFCTVLFSPSKTFETLREVDKQKYKFCI